MPSYWTRAVNSASAAKRFSISDFYPTEVGQEGCSVGGKHEWERMRTHVLHQIFLWEHLVVDLVKDPFQWVEDL